MERAHYLIDTNAVIDYLGKILPPKGMDFMNNVIDAVPNISVITKIEVLGFKAPAEHYQLLSNFMEDATILDLTGNIVDLTIDIRKNFKIKLPDAIIASTAIICELTLITRNISDFKYIKGLKILNPYNLLKKL
jgi:predicted nucleic acid-binding protein